jgi:aspartyl/glutamyl-tRNA(Asn/Gln) amidotransferase C subunit
VPVTETDVRRIAALARLTIDDARAGVLARELSAILDHMDLLARVPDLPSSEPVQPAEARTRDDRGEPLALLIPREEFAPLMRDGLFLVPRLDSHESAGG